MVAFAPATMGGLLVLSLVWILTGIHLTDADTMCEFPEYLQSPDRDGELLPWNTWMWWLYLRHIPKWSEKQEVYVKGSHMWRHRDRHNLKSCDRSPRRVYSASTFGDCTEREQVYNRTCITEHSFGKFRVIQYNADRTHRFTCMKFVRRSHNVVQVYEGPLSESNDEDLCDEDKMSLDEWPWVAEWHQRPYFCPVSGGFTFRTIRRLTNEDFCETEWRRSHLEVECVRGDGLHFMAPSGSNCNLFLKDGDFKSLNCWAGWDEGEYIFLVAADANSPRFCLRFPKYQNGEFSALVYFSVVCPTEQDGKPPLGIEYYELRMRRKDLFSCEDEDPLRCSDVLKDGGCTKFDVLAKHCPRSCGLCVTQSKPGYPCVSAGRSPVPCRAWVFVEQGDKEYEESSRSRCWFDLRLYGDWLLYEADRTEDVKIDRDSLSFSQLGNFRCWKTLNEAEYMYTTVSKFANGCSPRYTCFQFKRRNNNVLQYRAGHSYREDLETDRLCAFREDSYPLMDTYRSFYFKNLILAKDLWPSYCGLNAIIPFNGTFSGEVCEGEVGDWDPETCTTRGTIIFRSSTCASLIFPQEFQCLSFIQSDDIKPEQLLLTRSMDGRNEFNCWILSTDLTGLRWPYRVLYRMATTQCSRLAEMEIGITRQAKATLQLDDRGRSKTCKPDQELQLTATLDALTRSPEPKYVLPAIQDNPRTVNIDSQRLPPGNTQPTPPSGLSSGAGSSRLCAVLVLVLLARAAAWTPLFAAESPLWCTSWPAAVATQVGSRR